jgi:hypothetical protein
VIELEGGCIKQSVLAVKCSICGGCNLPLHQPTGWS